MALSELDMMNIWAKQLTGYKSQWERLFGFGYAIESEVRKDYDALIRQMLDALERCTKHNDADYEAITAARARLGGGIFAPENTHLFTEEAAAKAFAHVKPLGES